MNKNGGEWLSFLPRRLSENGWKPWLPTGRARHGNAAISSIRIATYAATNPVVDYKPGCANEDGKMGFVRQAILALNDVRGRVNCRRYDQTAFSGLYR